MEQAHAVKPTELYVQTRVGAGAVHGAPQCTPCPPGLAWQRSAKGGAIHAVLLVHGAASLADLHMVSGVMCGVL